MLNLKELLKDGPLLLDGATGTWLQSKGMPTGVCPELWMIEHPELVKELAASYKAAGSRIVYAPTFSGNRIKLAEYGASDQMEKINRTLVRWTKEAVQKDAHSLCYVAGNLTMTGQMLKPIGTLDFETLVDCYKEQVRMIASEGVDLFVIETMMHLGEVRAAVLAVKEETDLPVFVTMTFEPNGRTLYGTDPVSALVALQAMGVDAFGINCSCGPDLMLPWIAEMKKYAKIPLIAKSNAGLPKLVDGKTVFDMDKETFAQSMLNLIDAGVSVVGGCCGTSPEYIAYLNQIIKDTYKNDADNEDAYKMASGKCSSEENNAKTRWKNLYERIVADPQPEYARVLSSERSHVSIALDGPFKVIGERINPTGKKAFQSELRQGSLERAVDMAQDQVLQGAAVLDINVGLGGIDEKAIMLEAVEKVSETVDVPLCIDSSSIEVVEAALRAYHGRALVNSVSCERAKIEKLLPIVKKYGAMFILLPLTDEGLPKDLNERIANIHTVMDAALALGFKKEDMIVDGLTGSAGASAQAGMDTLETIAYAKSMGLATVCGLSNISFGLPDRSYVNSVFLALAISRGLTMAIANPSQELLMRCGFAADLLMGKQEANIRYIEACQKYNEAKAAAQQPSGTAQASSGQQTAQSQAAKTQTSKDTGCESLNELLAPIYEDILKGKSKQIEKHLEAALQTGIDASDILNAAMIPAINQVGQYFSQQRYYLPQLILSADAMRRGVDVLEPELLKKNPGVQGPTVVIATVKGDVHDIGKNLVAMMMKNYGFTVVDLGKDVDKDMIIEAAKAHKAQIIALSALMTTTMQYMQVVIDAVREAQMDVKVIVGGAAVTEEYAEKIGADGYSEDAVGAVKLVQSLLEM